jgi:DNA protecting protein DprA
VAIVGARSVTQYGRMVARSMGRGLAMAGVVVVSGLAMGIDTEAMLGAAQAGGRTVGVLGCGLGVTYPTSSGQHIPQIIERGALYSEYPTSTQPARHLFPERNTIIAGLSLGVCVVEAREKSGSLLTAEAALDAGRQVFAVPGDITRETSRGANRLIQAGAALVMESGDILRDLEPLLRNVTGSASAHEIPPAQARRRKALSQTLCDAEEDAGEDDPEPLAEAVRTARPMAPPAATQQAPAEGSIEHRIEAVLAVEPTQLNDLRIAPALAEVSQADMAMALLNLELDGRIRQLPGGIYVLNRGD